MTLLSGNRSPIGRLLRRILAIGSIYPVALLLTVCVDTLFGSEAFLDEFIYSSKSRLLDVVLNDWLSSAFVWLPLSIVAIVFAAILGLRFYIPASLVTGIAVVAFSLTTGILPLMLAFTLAMALVLPVVVGNAR